MKHTIVFLDRKSLIADMRAPSFAHEWVDHEQTTPGGSRGAPRRTPTSSSSTR